MPMTMVQTRRKSELVPFTHAADDRYLCRYAGVVRGANAYIPPGARRVGVIEEAPKSDIPKVSINGPDGPIVTHQASTSNGTTLAPAIVSTYLLCRITDSQLGHSPPVMLSFLLSVISSAARSKGLLRRNKPSSRPNATSGLRISSSSVRLSRLVSLHHLFDPGYRIDRTFGYSLKSPSLTILFPS